MLHIQIHSCWWSGDAKKIYPLNPEYIKNNAWVTVNNDFFVTSEAIRQKIIAESPHEWQKIVIHGNECIILFLTRYFMSWTHKSAKNYHRALISPLLPRAAFSDRALWRHHNWSVTSCEREILVLWRHVCLLSLHAQIGAKANSLVNNSREYRYLATRYSRLSLKNSVSLPAGLTHCGLVAPHGNIVLYSRKRQAITFWLNSKVQWHSYECKITKETYSINHCNKLENYMFKIPIKSPRDQWVC